MSHIPCSMVIQFVVYAQIFALHVNFTGKMAQIATFLPTSTQLGHSTANPEDTARNGVFVMHMPNGA